MEYPGKVLTRCVRRGRAPRAVLRLSARRGTGAALEGEASGGLGNGSRRAFLAVIIPELGVGELRAEGERFEELQLFLRGLTLLLQLRVIAGQALVVLGETVDASLQLVDLVEEE